MSPFSPRARTTQPLGCIAAVALVVSIGACDPNLPPPPGPDSPTVERVRQPIDPGAEGESRSLLQTYAKRNPSDADEAETWKLPYQAKRVAVALLISAALDRPEDLRHVMTPDAEWGLPDRRRLGARKIFAGDDGEAFLAQVRRAASLMPETTAWQSQPVLPGIEAIYMSGAEPMWTFWVSGDQYLVTSMVVHQGAARIDYVGMWDEEGPVSLHPAAGPAPPGTPKIRQERIVLPGE